MTGQIKDLGKRVLCEQNPKQELYKDVQFLPSSVYGIDTINLFGNFRFGTGYLEIIKIAEN